MYETVDDPIGSTLAIPEEARLKFGELADMVAARSLIVWGEHCSECAYPTCYMSCAFYTPRRDGHCRRFANGIEQQTDGAVTLGRIRLRQWAKLEGQGPAPLFAIRAAARRQHADRVVSALIVKFAPSQALYERSARHWNRLKARPIRPAATLADAFVVEAWLPSDQPLPATLAFVPADDGTHTLFQSRLDLQPGYNRFVVPYREIASRIDLSRRFLVQIEPVGEAIGREIVFGLIDFVGFKPAVRQAVQGAGENKRPIASAPGHGKKTRTAKCVVWDLDDTVWRGTLAEDGRDDLTLDPLVRETILELDRRGVLQSVVSKNDPDPALAALQAFGLRDYVLFPQIGWGPKSDAIKRIAERLDIGLDTFVFIDDQAFERGEVGERLPDVTVLPASDIPTLLTSPLFDLPVTVESAKRRTLYQTEELRQNSFAASDADYASFLRDCRIRLEIADLSELQEERAYELSQRTNQLNVSGTKYSRDEIKALMRPSSAERVYMLRCEDRFGDYGVIGMCVLDSRSGQVKSFMMSCRIQRKRVEHAFFGWLSRGLSAASPAGSITVNYHKTARNGAVFDLLKELGFDYRPGSDNDGIFVRSLAQPIAEDDVVEVIDLTAARAPALSG